MQAVRARVDAITLEARNSALPQSQIGVFKNVVQIEFNAWHYVEGNLWASLVEHIFSNLRTSAKDDESELLRRQEEVTKQLVSTGRRKRFLNETIDRLKQETDKKQADLDELVVEQRDQLKEVQRIRVGDIAAGVALTPEDVEMINKALPGTQSQRRRSRRSTLPRLSPTRASSWCAQARWSERCAG